MVKCIIDTNDDDEEKHESKSLFKKISQDSNQPTSLLAAPEKLSVAPKGLNV